MQNIQEQYFVLTLPLQTEAWQRDILEKRFEIHRQICDALLQKAFMRYGQMAQTRAYRNIREALSRMYDERERKKLFKERDCLIPSPEKENPFLVKASGFNHHTGTYQKMPLKKSWRIVDGQKVEKNLYSAFLLSNLAEDMQCFDLDAQRGFRGFWRRREST